MTTIKPFLPPVDPMTRLAQIHAEWNQFPGRRPRGTGETGLTSNDAQGYADMLNEQTEELGLQDQVAGKAPPTISERRQPDYATAEPADPYGGLNPNDPTPLPTQMALRALQHKYGKAK